MTEEKKGIIDIDDRLKSFESITKRIEILNEGFRTLYLDYCHHIEITHGREHSFSKLKENIDFRLFSSKFHLELLLKQHYIIEKRIEDIYQKSPEKIINQVYPSNPLFDVCEKEITSIFDSIIFHLASVYDYISAMVNFICNKKSQSITKWSQLVKSSRGMGNIYTTKNIAGIILDEDKKFVDKLYHYRSVLIHEKSQPNPISLTLKFESGKANVKLYTNESLTKKFNELKEKSETNNITVSYTSEWLIHMTITSISNILFGLKLEMEKMSTFPTHIASSDLITLYRDPVTGFMSPASTPMWKNVKDKLTFH